jgi:predicted XRE-type DNA-binding protein
MIEDHTITRSSANIFADAGLPDVDSQLVKAQLVSRIDHIIRERGLSQREAARILDVRQPDLSNILRGPLPGLLCRTAHALADCVRLRCQHRRREI